MSIGLIVALLVIGGYFIAMIITYFILNLVFRNEISHSKFDITPVITSLFWPVILTYEVVILIGKLIDFIILTPIRKFAFKCGECLDKKYQDEKG